MKWQVRICDLGPDIGDRLQHESNDRMVSASRAIVMATLFVCIEQENKHPNKSLKIIGSHCFHIWLLSIPQHAGYASDLSGKEDNWVMIARNTLYVADIIFYRFL